MKKNNQLLKNNALQKYIKDKKVKMSPKRMQLYECIVGLSEHLTMNEIFEKICAEKITTSFSTVYRAVKLLYEANILIQIQLNDGLIRYEQNIAQYHSHFICEKCKHIIEIDHSLEQNTYNKLLEQYEIFYVQTNIVGLCANCLEENKKIKRADILRC